MVKILFLPLLQMPSGHHQVAEALIDSLNELKDEEIVCEKVDLLQYTNPVLENVITTTYLKCLHYAPTAYKWLYENFGHTGASDGESLKFLQKVFEKKMLELIEARKPDLIICSHGFPSSILNRLKGKGQISVPVVNVYTDFFINDVWGKQNIEYHFVASKAMKQYLVETHHVPEHAIYYTGIPIHSAFSKNNSQVSSRYNSVLIAGGSNGLGNIGDFLLKNADAYVHFYVLCGTNRKLLKDLQALQLSNVTPLSYITSREEMNEIYEKVGAIITKPGGVTVSECLAKHVQILIHSYLPGQEKVNLDILANQGLVRKIDVDKPLSSVLKDVYSYKSRYRFERHRDEFLQDKLDAAMLLKKIINQISNKNSVSSF
ncbi:galactosyldiacylglycerol synthase [Bacillus sp. HMF5848]|uniref:MGDG synthase family glycosyltransferase n=1 Tax=Bacillus sp. HMF5848 TaxID=2495421 RepID=UPI000F7AC809|nr:galactosyldiacylglycerol synthase [Bacillus sp. HMF5848]RSK28240.1 galactosyldiacylglycerol synthase [Bacillus sp. HMF5848]